MAPNRSFETVTGYCWPQSAVAGDTVSLHLSSAGARPVSIEVARIGMQRTVVFEEPRRAGRRSPDAARRVRSTAADGPPRAS